MFGKNQRNHVSRRNVLRFGAGMLGTGALGVALGTEGIAPRRVDAIHPVLENDKSLYSDLEAATKANVLYQVEQLKSSPVIAQLIQAGKLKVIGAYYDLDTGVVVHL